MWRIWPLQKSSSADDMAAAEGDGDEKSKSRRTAAAPKSLGPPRVGLAGAL
jgi:hypothetical protein